MKNFIDMNWLMFRFSLALSLSCFILTGFDFMAFGLILMVMLVSLIMGVLFWEKIGSSNMKLIEKLGLEKCKAIVDGAPRGASHHSISTNHYYKYDSFYGLWEEYWDIPNAPMWQRVFSMSQEGKLERISDIRTAIADHERTDDCTDIRNHISNNTKVTER